MLRTEDRIEYTQNGTNYIKVTPGECFGWGGLCICNGCNKQVTDKSLNLCFLLGDCYCDDCLKDMTDHNGLTPEDLESDLKYQADYSLDWYKNYLPDPEEE